MVCKKWEKKTVKGELGSLRYHSTKIDTGGFASLSKLGPGNRQTKRRYVTYLDRVGYGTGA